VLVGNGDGTFRSGQVLGVGRYPSSLVAADFTDNGRLDLAVGDGGFHDVRVLLPNAAGLFPSEPFHIVLPIEHTGPQTVTPPTLPITPNTTPPGNSPSTSQAAPAAATATPLVVTPLSPGSGTVAVLESAATSTGLASGSGLEPVAATINDLTTLSFDTMPLAIQQDATFGDAIATSLLTGAKPTTRLQQGKGSSIGAVPVLTSEADSGGAPPAATDTDQPPSRMVDMIYRQLRPSTPPPAPKEGAAPPGAADPPLPGQSRLPLPAAAEEADSLPDPAADCLALALVASSAARAWWNSWPPGGPPDDKKRSASAVARSASVRKQLRRR
jgi:hypothetical protein